MNRVRGALSAVAFTGVLAVFPLYLLFWAPLPTPPENSQSPGEHAHLSNVERTKP